MTDVAKPAGATELKTVIKSIKIQQQGQVAKLQFKSESEAELLEAIRDYMQKRSELEHQYSKSVEKLGKTVLQRRFRKYLGTTPIALGGSHSAPGPPAGASPASATATPASPTQESATDAPTEIPSPTHAADAAARETYLAFASLLNESEVQAKSRSQIGDKLVASISDVIKDFNKEKTLSCKKNLDFCIKYQQELWLAYEDLDKHKQVYEKAAKEADAAQKKHDDAIKRPKSGLQALKNLVTGKDAEERIQKLKSKWKTKTRQLNDARNDYLLALMGTNAIQDLYYQDDMPIIMKKLDGEYYATLKSLLTAYTDLEVAFSASLKSSVDRVSSEVSKIDRQADIAVFLKDYSQTFNEPSTFAFDPMPTDEVIEMVVDDATKEPLGKRLGELIVRHDALDALLIQREKELAGIIQMAEAYTATPQFGNAASPLEQKQDTQNAIDLIKAQRTRIAKQMAKLKELSIVPIMPVVPEENPVLPTTSNAAKAGSRQIVVSADYAPQSPDEIAVVAGDAVEVILPSSDGRTKVRHAVSGAIGYVSSSVIKPAQDTDHASTYTSGTSASAQAPTNIVIATQDYEATDEGELSFKTGDQIECLDGIYADEEWWDGRVVRTGQSGTFSVHLTQGWEAVAAANANKPIKVSRGMTRRAPSVSLKNRAASAHAGGSAASAGDAKSIKVKALYSYEATCEGELTFDAGELLTVTNTKTGSDAWWEGEGHHGRGQFPVNYVQVLDDDVASSPVKERETKAPMSLVKETAQVRALYDFASTAAGELSFKAGDIVNVTQSSDADWWDGELNGATGAFPASYVERI
ncbi:hypothetical protein BC831DRAFT_473791 [Entophlyctis helioformis]|nr:hypothetical protein BC831DRAFT_473791 [Entophlyctis helioformis]